MLSMYITPFLMRPIDAIQNWKPYCLGFLAYLLMMPVFTNIFMIYAMCNLHDVSWGNRPSSTGQEAFTAKKKAQEQAKEDYLVFRTNFVFVWLAANVGYYIMILELRHSEGGRDPNLRDSDDGYLMYFSLGLSSLVLCRLVFSIIYVLKWKFRYNCKREYKIVPRDLAADVYNLKRTSNGESSDDEQLEEKLELIFE